MIKKIHIVYIIFVLILLAGCSDKANGNEPGIDIAGMNSSIGAVEGNTGNFETQCYKYNMTLRNNEAADMEIISVKPVLSDGFLERVSDKNVIIPVNKVIPQGGSLNVSGEIIFDAKGLTKEQIIDMEPFIKEVRIIEERTIDKSF